MSDSRPVSCALPSPDRVSVATSVVIVAYHRPDALARLLAALDAPDVDIVVVNVEADTAVRDAVAVHPGASVIDQENLGYAAAVNRGVTKATSDVVVFTNDDVILGSATVRALAERIRAGAADVVVPAVHDEHGRVSPTIAALPTPRNLLWQWALLPDTPIPGWPSRLRPEKWRRPGTAERVEAASAATVAVATELLAAVPLPEQYFLYWEESDWFVQLARCDASV